MVRPGWRPSAMAHTHADWIGHCTPCSSASEQGNCVRRSYTYPIGYGLTQPRVYLGYRVVMFDRRMAIWSPLSWRDAVLKSVSISLGVILRGRPTRDSEFTTKAADVLRRIIRRAPPCSRITRAIIAADGNAMPFNGKLLQTFQRART